MSSINAGADRSLRSSRSIRATLLPKIVLPVVVALFAGQASAFSNLYAFGDSLSDTGNVFLASGGTNPPPPYDNGRFSNGPIWLDNVAAALLLPFGPSLGGGTDYAFGGAITASNVLLPAYQPPSVPTLVDQKAAYLAAHGGVADPNALYVVFGGGNDLRAALQSQGSIGNTVSNLAGIISDLANAGARNFLVPNLPNLGRAPGVIALGPSAVGAAQSLSQFIDGQLAATLPGLASSLSTSLSATVSITQLDTYSILEGVITGAPGNGFTNTTDGCVTVACGNPNEYVFWDGLHPTAATGALLSQAALSVIPVPGAAWLFVSALSALGVARRRAA